MGACRHEGLRLSYLFLIILVELFWFHVMLSLLRAMRICFPPQSYLRKRHNVFSQPFSLTRMFVYSSNHINAFRSRTGLVSSADLTKRPPLWGEMEEYAPIASINLTPSHLILFSPWCLMSLSALFTWLDFIFSSFLVFYIYIYIYRFSQPP